MTTPTKAQKNLVLARFVWPHSEWHSDSEDHAVNNAMYMFDIRNIRDREKVEIKLKLNHSITIHERKRSGRTVWEAVTHKQMGGGEMAGIEPLEDLGELLYRLVEGLQNG